MSDLSILWTAVVVVVLLIFLPKLVSRFKRRGAAAFGIDVEADLLRACRGDKAMADRLIEHEIKNHPGLSRTGAALMALSRLRDDNR